MNLVIKSTIFRSMTIKFPNADLLVADINRKLLIGRCTTDESKTRSVPLPESEYLQYVEGTYGIKDLALIEANTRTRKIRFIGSNKEMEI